MRKFLLFAAFLLCTGLSSCQCSDKPDIGPVQGQGAGASVLMTAPQVA